MLQFWLICLIVRKTYDDDTKRHKTFGKSHKSWECKLCFISIWWMEIIGTSMSPFMMFTLHYNHNIILERLNFNKPNVRCWKEFYTIIMHNCQKWWNIQNPNFMCILKKHIIHHTYITIQKLIPIMSQEQ